VILPGYIETDMTEGMYHSQSHSFVLSLDKLHSRLSTPRYAQCILMYKV